ncbi:MAG TPA: glycosyltransferase family 2 protein [Ferruginibacter sp.]|nr:glycosyltransferase family 2 protein [Ferruginibacter sp.]
MNNPLISICIPAYKNDKYLEVLLNSISNQTFRDFEVIITDDSPGNEVESLCNNFHDKFRLTYLKNIPSKGSPANWNAAIKKASGRWIKIMHDDDWFSNNKSLDRFARAINENPGINFIFSGFSEYENGKAISIDQLPKNIQLKLKRTALTLFKKNYIGHPSTTLIKNNLTEWYDENIKWVVDFEFYIRVLKTNSFSYIDEPLINIGISHEQITKAVFRKKEVEIPENIYLLNKLGIGVLGNIWVYDYYWRLIRNLGIRHADEMYTYLNGQPVPNVIGSMIKYQKFIPLSLLRIGAISKLNMFLSYLINR